MEFNDSPVINMADRQVINNISSQIIKVQRISSHPSYRLTSQTVLLTLKLSKTSKSTLQTLKSLM